MSVFVLVFCFCIINSPGGFKVFISGFLWKVKGSVEAVGCWVKEGGWLVGERVAERWLSEGE